MPWSFSSKRGREDPASVYYGTKLFLCTFASRVSIPRRTPLSNFCSQESANATAV